MSRQLPPDVFAAACPSCEVLDHLTSRWSGLVLVALSERVHRFSELRTGRPAGAAGQGQGQRRARSPGSRAVAQTSSPTRGRAGA